MNHLSFRTATQPRLMLRAIVFLSVFIIAIRATAQDNATPSSPPPILRVQVTDETGRPVPNAEASLIELVNNLPALDAWAHADAHGFITINESHFGTYVSHTVPTGKVLLTVRAPGSAFAARKLSLPLDDPNISVTLPRGRTIDLIITTHDGAPLPESVEPIIYTAGQSVAAWVLNVQNHRARLENPAAGFSAALLERADDGVYRLRVPDDLAQFWIIVDHPEIIRAFQYGPIEFDALADDHITIELPEPASLLARLRPKPDAATAYDSCGLELMVAPEIPDGGWTFRIAREFAAGKSNDIAAANLAPGFYTVYGMTGDATTADQRDRADYYQEQRGQQLEPGQAVSIDFDLETFDEQALRERMRGDKTIIVNFTKTDGSPAAGRAYDLSFNLRNFGRNMTASSGAIPEDGRIVLRALPPGALVATVDDQFVGYVFIQNEPNDQTFDFRLAPVKGDAAPDITMTSLATDETFTLSSLRGRVVLLEFWASWCGPCQEPMAHNDALMRSRGESWKDRATIIGLSIDNTMDLIRNHVTTRGWTHVLQTFTNGAWQAEAVKLYGVSAVPTAFLIDQRGIVVWSGHPSEIDVEKEIDALLAERK